MTRLAQELPHHLIKGKCSYTVIQYSSLLYSLTLSGKKSKAHDECKSSKPSAKKEIKTTITKDKSKTLLDPCPQLYAPRGTKPSKYLPVIIKFFEDFKLQLRVAQSTCVPYVPWSPPLANCAKRWQGREDRYSDRESSSTLVLSPPVKQSQQRKQQEMVDLSPAQDWGHYVYNSDDQNLFNDSDHDFDSRSSQPASTFNCHQTPPLLDDITDTIAASNRSPFKPTVPVSPHIRDISIDISSSDSEFSPIVAKQRKKRKPLGARVMADSSEDIVVTPEADNDRLSLTPSFSRTPVHPLSSQSPSQGSREPLKREGYVILICCTYSVNFCLIACLKNALVKHYLCHVKWQGCFSFKKKKNNFCNVMKLMKTKAGPSPYVIPYTIILFLPVL